MSNLVAREFLSVEIAHEPTVMAVPGAHNLAGACDSFVPQPFGRGIDELLPITLGAIENRGDRGAVIDRIGVAPATTKLLQLCFSSSPVQAEFEDQRLT